MWPRRLAGDGFRPDQRVSCALSNIEPHATRIFACECFLAKNETTANICAAVAGELQRNLPAIDATLTDRACLLGPDPAVADIMLCTILRMIEGSELMAPLERLRGYMGRLQARPAFGRALALNDGFGAAAPG